VVTGISVGDVGIQDGIPRVFASETPGRSMRWDGADSGSGKKIDRC